MDTGENIRQLAEQTAPQFGYSVESVFTEISQIISDAEAVRIAEKHFREYGWGQVHWYFRDRDDQIKRYDFWKHLIRGQYALAILHIAANLDRAKIPGIGRRARVNIVSSKLAPGYSWTEFHDITITDICRAYRVPAEFIR